MPSMSRGEIMDFYVKRASKSRLQSLRERRNISPDEEIKLRWGLLKRDRAPLPPEEKTAEVSKAELKKVLQKHEDRETPAQEAAESKEEQAVEERAGMHEKSAFIFGMSKEKRERGHALARAGFEDNVGFFNSLHPMPKKTVEGWRKELSPDKHTAYHHGHNHFSDKFNPWLQTDEGKKWNEAQAKKQREKTAFARGFEKQARELTTKRRNSLSSGDFVFPETRRYPIHDESHARNALARVSQYGTPDEKKRVRAAVHGRYPGIGD